VLDHVSLGVADLERSRHFYDATLRPLGLVRLLDFEGRGSDYGSVPHPHGVQFTITTEGAVEPSRGAHLCFRAPDRAAVRAFHTAALAAGGVDAGAAGLRPNYHPATTPRSCSIPTDTASKPCATRRMPSARPRCTKEAQKSSLLFEPTSREGCSIGQRKQSRQQWVARQLPGLGAVIRAAGARWQWLWLGGAAGRKTGAGVNFQLAQISGAFEISSP
jgi:catechol 2,3-dioxygenase-like lactoylglutathione lyase family enzyme